MTTLFSFGEAPFTLTLEYTVAEVVPLIVLPTKKVAVLPLLSIATLADPLSSLIGTFLGNAYANVFEESVDGPTPYTVIAVALAIVLTLK